MQGLSLSFASRPSRENYHSQQGSRKPPRHVCRECTKLNPSTHVLLQHAFYTSLFYIISMSVYISATLRLGHQGPCPGSHSDPSLAVPFLGVKNLRGQGDRSPRAHDPLLWVSRTPESPTQTPWDRPVP